MPTSSIPDELHPYGILTENSHIRAHVSVVNRCIYVFPTAAVIDAIRINNPQERTAGQPGVKGPTALGWLVRPEWIEDIRRIKYHSWRGWDRFKPIMTTSEKGALAVLCVMGSMKLGRFPFWVEAQESDNAKIQIMGTDIVIYHNQRVQVKCDWKGGDQPAGTGNLFIQRAERNPLGRR